MTVIGFIGMASMEAAITRWGATGYPYKAGSALGWTDYIFVFFVGGGIALTAYSAISLQKERSKKISRTGSDSQVA